MKLRWGMGFLLGFLLVSVSACNDPVGRVVPVKGKVAVNGKALKTGSITFWPDESKGNKSQFEAGGTIGEDGSYELFTKERKGAPPGAYKVTIVAQEIPDATKPEKAPPSLVPAVYNDKKTTTLTKEVVESPAAGAYDFDVK